MKIAAVLPAYRVKDQILAVIERFDDLVSAIYVVDDKCPEQTGAFVAAQCSDPRVKVIYRQENGGVGGATISGYRAAIQDGMDIVVKVDGDGQMDPRLIGKLVQPIIDGHADYTKGNRFFNLESLKQMPLIRLFGNSVLSFINKATSGYWNLMDPTNGFTAAHVSVLEMLPLHKIDNRYFFESDMLFRLNTVRAVVKELPMDACYGGEKSNLKIGKIFFDFPGKYLNRFIKRLFYNYFLRDFNVCSVNMLLGSFLCSFGLIFGAAKWYQGYLTQTGLPLGTIMVANLPIILGFQLLIAAVNFDVTHIPKDALHPLIERR